LTNDGIRLFDDDDVFAGTYVAEYEKGLAFVLISVLFHLL
jgi:hypothetical protein